MKPDQLYTNFAAIIEDVCGPYAALREGALTEQEWREIDQRWVTMYGMNKPRGAANGHTGSQEAEWNSTT